MTAPIRSVPAVSTETEAAEVVTALHAAGRLTAADKRRSVRAGLEEVVAPCVAALAVLGEPAVEPRVAA